MDCSPWGSSIHGIFQARVLEWVAISFSRGSSQPRDWTQVSCIVGKCFTIWATREVRRQVKWSGIPISKNFPQFVVIHRVKDFTVVSEAEVDIFLEFPCVFYDPTDVGNWYLVPLPFLNPAWTYGSSRFTYCWSLAWRILSITLLVCEMSAIVQFFEYPWHCLSLVLEWKLTFSSPVAIAVFSKFAGILSVAL